jgi:hypothetical protein
MLREIVPFIQMSRHSEATLAVVTEMAADVGIIYVMLVLQACRIQELQGHRSFHPDFKRKPRRPSNGSGSLQAAPESCKSKAKDTRDSRKLRYQEC